MRPESLAKVAVLLLQGERFGLALDEFLDDFYADPKAERLTHEPKLLAGKVPKGDVYDAYLAAVAETLATDFALAVPNWARQTARALARPWFALDYSSMRAILLAESPPGFRARNLFVSENALSRV